MARTTVTKTISLEKSTLRKAVKGAKARGFTRSMSAYIGKLIEDDDHALNQQQNGKAVPA